MYYTATRETGDVLHSNKGDRRCTTQQQGRQEMYYTATRETGDVLHSNKGDRCTTQQQGRQEMYYTATRETGDVLHSNKGDRGVRGKVGRRREVPGPADEVCRKEGDERLGAEDLRAEDVGEDARVVVQVHGQHLPLQA